MNPLLFVIPIFLFFEVWQLVISERYMGVKVGPETDPRTLGLGERTACAWFVGILLTWSWMIFLLFDRRSRTQGICMIAVTVLGYVFRRTAGLRLSLVILTLEGALRIGMMLSLIGMMFFRYRGVYRLG